MAETAEQWIKSIEKRVNGWDDFDVFRRHYSGEGNVSHRATTADHLQNALHYKIKCGLSFTTFLYRTHKLFNIFRDEEEAMADSTQVPELFRRVQSPQLQDTFKSLEVRDNLDGITYLEAYKHLTAVVSNTPDY